MSKAMSRPIKSLLMRYIAAGPPPAGPALRNVAKNTGGGGTSTPTVTIPATLTGSCIVVQINDGSAANVTSVTDNVGNTYLVGQAKISSGGENLYVYYCLGATAGVTTVQVNFSGTGDASVFVGELTGITGFDSSGTAGGVSVGSPPYAFSSNALAQSVNFAWIAFNSASSALSQPYTESTGAIPMIQETNTNVYWSGACWYKITSATTAVSATVNGTSISNPCRSILIFKG